MARTYTTVMGDTWDQIAYDMYGDERYMDILLQANRPLIDVMIFNAGTTLQIPDLPEDTQERLPFWRD